MRGKREAGRSVVVLLLSILLAGTVTPVQAASQSQNKTSSPTDSIILRAEETFHRGEEAWSKSLPDIARKLFDESLDTILQSGIDLKTMQSSTHITEALSNAFINTNPSRGTRISLTKSARNLRRWTSYPISKKPS